MSSTSASGRTWDEASAPGATRLARRFESDWRASDPSSRPHLDDYLPPEPASCPGARLALLRAEMVLRAEAGEAVRVEGFRQRFPDLSEETLVALIYEEFCLREEAGEGPDPGEFRRRFPEVDEPLRRVFDIHGLVGTASFGPMEGGASAPAVPLPEAGQTIGGFRLVDELGRGAFARVFLAEERQLADRPVALKVARGGSREPSTLARLQHTHIVPVHSYRVDPATGLHLLCMPYLGGVTLAQLFADPKVKAGRSGAAILESLDRLEPTRAAPNGRASGREALRGRSYVRAIAWWGARLAEALAHAHERGVLHRDVKPSNVLVTSDGLPMLLDFNLAWETRLDEPGIEPGALGGTLAYMAPEHLEALADGVRGGDARADIYALGVVLFEAMGERPFAPPSGGGSMAAALLRAADERRFRVPRLRDEQPEIPAEFDAVVARCLAPDPAKRYASASDLAADLRAVADDRALPHARVPLPARAGGWLRRNRVRAAVAAAVAAVPILLAVGAMQSAFARQRQAAQVQVLLSQGDGEVGSEHFELAMSKYDTASKLAEGWRSAELRDLFARSREKFNLAGQTLKAREKADQVIAEAEYLRFGLLGIGGRPSENFGPTESTLDRFYVLRGAGNWTSLGEIRLLDPARRRALVATVDDLMFLLAVATIRPDGEARPAGPPSAGSVKALVALCDRALAFTNHPGPWRALRSWAASLDDRGRGEVVAAPPFSEETSGAACFRWGVLRRLQGRKLEATSWIERAAWLEPDSYWAQYYLAHVHEYVNHDAELARTHIEAAIALRPGSPFARFDRARLEYAQGRWGRALADLEFCLKSIRDDPGAESARRAVPVRLVLANVLAATGDLAAARREFDRVLGATAEDDPKHAAAMIDLAKLDAEAGGRARALGRYAALLERDPADDSARLGHASISLLLGDSKGAARDLDLLLAGAPADPDLLARRALVALARGDHAPARRDATEAARRRPGPDARRLLARAEIAGGNLDRMPVDDPERIALLPGDPESLGRDLRAALAAPRGRSSTARLQQAVIASALGRHDDAERIASEVARAFPSSALAWRIRARVRLRGGDLAGAGEDVARGLDVEPEDPGLLALRGRIAASRGAIDDAMRDFDRSLASGGGTEAIAGRAEAAMRKGELDRAMTSWNAAIAEEPAVPAFYLGRAACLRRLGGKVDAAAEVQRAASCCEDRRELLRPIVAEAWRVVRLDPTRWPMALGIANRLLAAPSY